MVLSEGRNSDGLTSTSISGQLRKIIPNIPTFFERNKEYIGFKITFFFSFSFSFSFFFFYIFIYTLFG